MQANGLLSRDGNPHTLTGALVEFPSFSDTLQDVRTSNDTRVTIDNNAAAISALAGLNEASGSWDQCLQVGNRAGTGRIEVYQLQLMAVRWFLVVACMARGQGVQLRISADGRSRRWTAKWYGARAFALCPGDACQPGSPFWGGALRDIAHVQGFGVLTHDKAVCDASQL